MKTYRQLVLLAYCAAVCVVCLYPPWKVSLGPLRHNSRYSLLWKPPWVYENGQPYDAVVDLARVGLELVAVTAFAGFLLLLGEVGQRLRPPVTVPLWVTKKVVWPVIALAVLGGWGFYGYWHEQRRIQQVVKQKTVCDSLWNRCREKAPLMMERTGQGIRVYRAENCGGDLPLKQEYDTCLVRVRALQTEQERQRDEQQRETALSSDEPFLSPPDDKKR